jgi:signal transduction histidine kinase
LAADGLNGRRGMSGRLPVVDNDPVVTRQLTATRWAVTARRSGKGLAYLMLALPLDVVTAFVMLVGGLLGTLLLVTPFGAWLLAGLLRAAVGLGGLRRRLVARLLDEQVPAPTPAPAGGGAFRWRRAVLADPVGWRALAYALVKLPFSVLSLFLGGGCLVYAVVLLTFFPLQEQHVDSWSALVVRWLVGLALLLLFPWALQSVLTVERMLVRGLLGASRSSRRMTDLRETRDRAVADADATLRRIERDLHDGAQARLVGVGMQLAMVSELIAAGAPPQRLRAAVDTTQDALTAAIAELRDLVRGIHPPVLDRGLAAALTTVAAGSAVPTVLSTDLPRRPPPAVESIVYFSACELLTNAGRHGGARGATIEVSLRDDVLLLRVGDDGHGGAHQRAGGGLAGLAERVRVVDGRLVIDSPAGGPTTVTVEIPCPARPEEP